MSRIDFGRRYVYLKGPVKLRFDVRSIVVTVMLLAATAAIGVFALMVGTLELSIHDVFSALIGQSTGMTELLCWSGVYLVC